MQAILTKFLPSTDTHNARIKASCERGSITINCPDELSGHIAAADALVEKFVMEDNISEYYQNPWTTDRVCGQLPDGSYAHVFLD